MASPSKVGSMPRLLPQMPYLALTFLLLSVSLVNAFELSSSHDTSPNHVAFPFLWHRQDVPVPANGTSTNSTLTDGNGGLSDAEYEALLKLVKSGKEKVSATTRARERNLEMYRNQYILRPGTEPGARLSRREEAEIYIRAKADSLAAGADQITDEEREAARRLTEYEARQKAKSGTLFADYEELGVAPPEPTAATEKRQAGGSWWAERLDHVVGGPFGLNPQYRVWRNVKDYGAKGNGVDDDTAAIKRAVQEGNRCGDKCNGTTTTPATIYFPQGTYLLSEEILGLFHTQFVGDPTPGRTPVLKASKFFQGESVISTDYYIPGGSGAQWWINTANFYRQLRNFIIDIRDVDFQDAIYGIHYQAAQACSIENVQIHARRKDYITAHGIHAENGSGGTMHGVVVLGADVGIWGGNQQYTAIGVQIRDCTVGIHMIWDWGWTWQNILMENVEIGFQLVGEDEKYRGVGSIYLLDSTISASKVQIQIMPYNKGPANGNTQITIDNCAFSGTSTVIADINGKPYFSMTGNIDAYIWGNVANPENPAGTWREGLRMDDMKRDEGLTFPGNNGLKHKPYFVKMKPSYTNLSPSDIVQVGKSCPRNGRDDATQCIQRILDANSGLSGPTKIIFFDYGTYKVTDTLNIHPGTYIVGESWSQLVASGEKFGDMKKPRPLVRVGKKDEVGTVEIQDIMFTTMGATAGLVAVEWNLKGKSPHDAAMWDSHVRIGGAAETGLAMKDCPLGSTVDNKCIAGSMLMHITSSASGYFENVWLWVADHDIEDIAMTQVNVYVGRGLLVESQNPVWLYGTSSEHCVLYQYQFHKAKRIYAGMIQTESPYYQPSPAAPAPFESALGIFPADPTFKEKGVDLKSSWGVRIIRSSDIVIAGAGLYSWFSSYAQQPCISELACQNSMVEINNVGQGVYIWNLVTIGTTQMITDTTISPPRVVLAKPNINADDDNAGQGHPKWALLNIYQPNPGAGVDSCVTVYDDMIWEWDRPLISVRADGCTNILAPSPLAHPVDVTAEVTITIYTVGSGRTTTAVTEVTTVFPISEVPFQPFVIEPGDVPTTVIDGTTRDKNFIYTPVENITPPPGTMKIPSGWQVYSPEPLPTLPTGTESTTSSTTTVIGGIIPVPDPNDDDGWDFPIPWPPTRYPLPTPDTTKKPRPTPIPSDDNDEDPEDEGEENVDDTENEEDDENEDDNNNNDKKEKDRCNPLKNIFAIIDVTCYNTDGIVINPIKPPVPPKPTCISGCPTLEPCPPTRPDCNLPCRVGGCPPGKSPVPEKCNTPTPARGCIEYVSSTLTRTSPVSEWSSTTWDFCTTMTGCGVRENTVTKTIKSSTSADPVITPTYDYDERGGDNGWSDADLSSIAAAQSAYLASWRSRIEPLPTPTSTPTPTIPESERCTLSIEYKYVSPDWANYDKLYVEGALDLKDPRGQNIRHRDLRNVPIDEFQVENDVMGRIWYIGWLKGSLDGLYPYTNWGIMFGDGRTRFKSDDPTGEVPNGASCRFSPWIYDNDLANGYESARRTGECFWRCG